MLSEMWPGAIDKAQTIIDILKANGVIIFTAEVAKGMGLYYKHTGVRVDRPEELYELMRAEADEYWAADKLVDFDFGNRVA